MADEHYLFKPLVPDDKTFKDGEPGDFFIVGDPGRWAIWRFLREDEYPEARDLGYNQPKLVTCVLFGGSDRNMGMPIPDPEDDCTHYSRVHRYVISA